jgi:hypothetical protein
MTAFKTEFDQCMYDLSIRREMTREKVSETAARLAALKESSPADFVSAMQDNTTGQVGFRFNIFNNILKEQLLPLAKGVSVEMVGFMMRDEVISEQLSPENFQNGITTITSVINNTSANATLRMKAVDQLSETLGDKNFLNAVQENKKEIVDVGVDGLINVITSPNQNISTEMRNNVIYSSVELFDTCFVDQLQPDHAIVVLDKITGALESLTQYDYPEFQEKLKVRKENLTLELRS